MSNLRPRDKFGPYVLRKFLGRGGMGEVWRAYEADPGDAPDVALKILLAAASEAGVSITREVQGLKKIGRHASVCSLLDFGDVQGVPFLALELLDGADLETVRREAGGRLSLERIRTVAVDILDGLAHLHRNGVYHRDLKPGNIRVLSSGRAKILDLGIAKIRSLTRAVTLHIDSASKRIGTPQFMPPEQWEGETEGGEFGKVDGRSDLYSFGIMLFELLAGELPFQGELSALYYAHTTLPPPSLCEHAPEAPPAIENVFRRLVAKRREDRFSDAPEAKRALLAALGPLGTSPSVIADGVAAPDAPAGAQTLPLPPAPTLPGGPSPTKPGTASAAAPTAPLQPLPSRPTGTFALAVPTGALKSLMHPRGPAAPPIVGTPAIGAEAASARQDGPVPRLQLRTGMRAAERVLHLHAGSRATFGRNRRPDPGETWADVPTFALRYLPVGDAAMRTVTSETVSRRHFEVGFAPEGAYIVDSSSAGTSLNGERLTRGQRAPLPPVARLRIGKGPLELEIVTYTNAATGAPAALRLARIGNGEDHAYLLFAGAVAIGSDAAVAALALDPSLGVAPVHALLIASAESGLAVASRDAAAPVTVNGVLLAHGEPRTIEAGDRLGIGGAIVVLESHPPDGDAALR